jgi:hypothetical protein
MGVVGNLPDRQRMPRIGDDGCVRQREPAQKIDDDCDNDNFGRQHRKPHRGDRFGDPRDREEDHLRDRRIGGHRVVGAIDVRKDRGIAQRGERWIGRHIEVWIDARALNASVPNVAIEIGREQRLLAEQQSAHREREDENDDETDGLLNACRIGSRQHGEQARRDERRNENSVPIVADDPGRGRNEQ